MEIINTLIDTVSSVGIIILITLAFFAIFGIRKFTVENIRRQTDIINSTRQENKTVIFELSKILKLHSEDNHKANAELRDFVMKICGDIIVLEEKIGLMKKELTDNDKKILRKITRLAKEVNVPFERIEDEKIY